MGLSLVTPPALEPLTVPEVKTFLRIDSALEDTILTSLVKAAREEVEHFTRRALITQTWDYTIDAFPAEGYIKLPLPPLQSVTSLKFTDEDGVVSTVSASTYYVDTSGEPGLIALMSGESWPSDTLRATGAVTARFVAGYGAAASDPPEAVRLAMYQLVSHWYENHEAVLVGSIAKEMPLTCEYLLWPLRHLRF